MNYYLWSQLLHIDETGLRQHCHCWSSWLQRADIANRSETQWHRIASAQAVRTRIPVCPVDTRDSRPSWRKCDEWPGMFRGLNRAFLSPVIAVGNEQTLARTPISSRSMKEQGPCCCLFCAFPCFWFWRWGLFTVWRREIRSRLFLSRPWLHARSRIAAHLSFTNKLK